MLSEKVLEVGGWGAVGNVVIVAIIIVFLSWLLASYLKAKHNEGKEILKRLAQFEKECEERRKREEREGLERVAQKEKAQELKAKLQLELGIKIPRDMDTDAMHAYLDEVQRAINWGDRAASCESSLKKAPELFYTEPDWMEVGAWSLSPKLLSRAWLGGRQLGRIRKNMVHLLMICSTPHTGMYS